MNGQTEVGMVYVRYYRGPLDGLCELIEMQMAEPPLETIACERTYCNEWQHVYSIGGWSGGNEDRHLIYVYEGLYRKNGGTRYAG